MLNDSLQWPEPLVLQLGKKLLTRTFQFAVIAVFSGFRMGRALKEMLLYFNWKRIAMFYTDDGATRRCYSIAEGLRKTLIQAGIINVLNTAVDRATANDDEIEKFLNAMSTFARSKYTKHDYLLTEQYLNEDSNAVSMR